MREAWFAAVLVLTTLSACRPGDSGIPPISFPPPITGIVPPTDASAAPSNTRPSLPEIEVDLSELDRELDQVQDALDAIDLNQKEGNLP